MKLSTITELNAKRSEHCVYYLKYCLSGLVSTK